MYRRHFLEATAASLGITRSYGSKVATLNPQIPPGILWRQTFAGIASPSTVTAPDGGFLIVGRSRAQSSPDTPIRLVMIDSTGGVRQSTQILPEIPEAARRATVDAIRVKEGFAVATGPWFATLDPDLSITVTGSVPNLTANSTTLLTEFSAGFAIATELDTPNHVSTRILGFDTSGDHMWSRKYGQEHSTWAGFLFDGLDGGLIFGSPDPRLAGITADGTHRTASDVREAPPGSGYAATRDEDEITLFGSGSIVNLTSSWGVDWSRTYEAFTDTYEGELIRTPDGGYVIAADASGGGVRVGRTDSQGRLLWSHTYDSVGGGVSDLLMPGPDEYLVVGSDSNEQAGWMLRLSGSVTPTTTTSSPVTTTPATTQPSPETTTPTSTSETDVPGFGIGAAILGTALGALARRR